MAKMCWQVLQKTQYLWLTCSWFTMFWNFAFKLCIFRHLDWFTHFYRKHLLSQFTHFFKTEKRGVIKYQFQNFGKGAALFIGPIKLQIVNLSVIRLQWNGFVSYQTSMDSLSGVSFIVWLFVCLYKVAETVKDFVQSLQQNFFWCPECAILWYSRLLKVVKDFTHWGQENGLSPVWIILWIMRVCSCANIFPHCLHMNFSSPVWIFWCTFRLELCANNFEHWLHLKVFSPVWSCWCLIRLTSNPNDFKHRLHW